MPSLKILYIWVLEKIFKCLPYISSWSCDLDYLYNFCFPPPPSQGVSIVKLALIGRAVSENTRIRYLKIMVVYMRRDQGRTASCCSMVFINIHRLLDWAFATSIFSPLNDFVTVCLHSNTRENSFDFALSRSMST